MGNITAAQRAQAWSELYPRAHAELANWGEWQGTIISDVPATSSGGGFEEFEYGDLALDRAKEPYRENPAAERCDLIIARYTRLQDQMCLQCLYVSGKTSTESAHYMTRQGLACDRKRYAEWLGVAIAKVDTAYFALEQPLYTGIEK